MCTGEKHAGAVLLRVSGQLQRSFPSTVDRPLFQTKQMKYVGTHTKTASERNAGREGEREGGHMCPATTETAGER